jgi:hypothetical protein
LLDLDAARGVLRMAAPLPVFRLMAGDFEALLAADFLLEAFLPEDFAAAGFLLAGFPDFLLVFLAAIFFPPDRWFVAKNQNAETKKFVTNARIPSSINF